LEQTIGPTDPKMAPLFMCMLHKFFTIERKRRSHYCKKTKKLKKLKNKTTNVAKNLKQSYEIDLQRKFQ